MQHCYQMLSREILINPKTHLSTNDPLLHLSSDLQPILPYGPLCG